MAIKYDQDFTLYDHYIHALEYLGYNFDRSGSSTVEEGRHHSFAADDEEWSIEIDVKLTRKPPR